MYSRQHTRDARRAAMSSASEATQIKELVKGIQTATELEPG
jgi:hypothetical protein